MAVFSNPTVNELIFDTLAEGLDFQSLICCIADHFDVDIAVVTLDGKPLFRSGDFVLSDSRRYYRMSDSSNVYLSSDERERTRVGATIFSDELPFGAVLVNCSEKESLSDASAIAESLSKVYQYFFDLHEQKQTFPFINQILAHYLLSDSFMPNAAYTVLDELSDWSSSKMRFHPGYAVAVFRSASSDMVAIPSGVISQIPKYIPNSYCIKKDNSILTFVYGLEGKSAANNRILFSELDSFCRNNKLHCAVSAVFDDLADRKAAVKQASVLVINRKKLRTATNVIFAEQLQKELILFGALEVSDSEIFRLSDVEMLFEYDKLHGTDYTVTLESYLLSAGQFTKAAKMLYLDRGTLKYRMSKIRDLLSCDPDDPDAAERLLLALAIRKFLDT